MDKIEGCEIEYDSNRGVIYVHHPAGWSILRICGVPKDLSFYDQKTGSPRLTDICISPEHADSKPRDSNPKSIVHVIYGTVIIQYGRRSKDDATKVVQFPTSGSDVQGGIHSDEESEEGSEGGKDSA